MRPKAGATRRREWLAAPGCRKVLQQDLKRDFGRATLLDQIDCTVEVDVMACPEQCRRIGVVANPFERLCAPALDPVDFCLFYVNFNRRHVAILVVRSLIPSTSAKRSTWISQYPVN